MMPDSSADTDQSLDIIGHVLAWRDAGHGAALATVIETWGSSPCPAGSMLAIRDDATFLGSVSGGCIEGEVVTEALALIRGGGFKTLEFGIADEDAWHVGLACGGRVRVGVAEISTERADVLHDLQTARDDKRPVALLTDLASGTMTLAPPDSALAPRFAADKSGIEEMEDGAGRFVQVFNPALRLFIVGAVHIAQALAKFGAECGYDVTIIDPRDTWGTEARFPGVTLDRRWPSTALAALGPDARSAVVTLCHDPKLDDPALMEVLDSEVFYIGSLGSRKTHAKRLDRLRAEGATAAQVARIHAPVGLDIGARSPQEIALSVMGQITEALRKAR